MNTDARKLKPEQQELLRLKAIRLRRKGKTFREIGQLLDVQKRSPKNTPRRLTEQLEQQVMEMIHDQMPDQYKLGFALWTRRAIAQLIKLQWNIDIPVRTLGDWTRNGFLPTSSRPCITCAGV